MGDMQNAGEKTKNNKLYRYIYNLVVSTSDWLYTLCGGTPRVSFSQMLGFRFLEGEETWWSKPLRIAVDFLFKVLMNETEHCKNSVEGESNIRGLYKIDKRLALRISKRTVSMIEHHPKSDEHE